MPTRPGQLEVRFFGRQTFNGDFRGVKPKMHITTEVDTDRYGVFTGVCGYEWSNILGELRVVKTQPKKAELCGKCLKKMRELDMAAVAAAQEGTE